MPRPEKVQAVADIKEQFEAARAVFLTEYRGIPVKEMGDLRRRLRDSGAEYKVVKMSLARRAVDDLGLEAVGEQLVGPTALAFALSDPVSTAKALREYSRENDNLVIKLGLLADKVLQPEDVVKLAEIEPREVLLAKIAGAAKAPLTNLASMVSSFTRDAAGLFSALLDKREEAEGGEAAATEAVASPESPESPESPGSPDTPDEAEEESQPSVQDQPEEEPAESSDEDPATETQEK